MKRAHSHVNVSKYSAKCCLFFSKVVFQVEQNSKFIAYWQLYKRVFVLFLSDLIGRHNVFSSYILLLRMVYPVIPISEREYEISKTLGSGRLMF